MPDESEVLALQALLLIQQSRRGPSVDREGELVSLEEQDRALWDREAIEEGLTCSNGPRSIALSDRISRKGRSPGSMRGRIPLRRPIGAVFLGFYDLLERVAPSPVVRLNRAAALAMVEGWEAGLQALEVLRASDELAGSIRSTSRAPSCCAVPVATPRRSRPTARPSNSSVPMMNGACSNAARVRSQGKRKDRQSRRDRFSAGALCGHLARWVAA